MVMALVAFSGCAHRAHRKAASVAMGDRLDFRVTTRDGQKLKTEDLEHNLVLIDMWSSDGGTQPALAHLADLYTRLGAHGLEVVSVAADPDREAAEAALATVEVPYRLIFDPERLFPRRLGLSQLPSFVILDGYGRVVHVQEGYREELWKVEWVVRKGLEMNLHGRARAIAPASLSVQ